MNRRQFLQCTAALGLTALLPTSTEAAIPTTATGSVISEFGNRLIKKLPAQKNLFISPFSIATALAMTGAGAAGTTWAQFGRVLGFSSKEEMIRGFSRLLPQVTSSGEYQLATANGLFLDNTLKLHAPYRMKMEKQFRGKITQLDFRHNPKASTAKVNSWIASVTRQKIKKVLDPDRNIRCVLANAIYFKADWERAFNKDFTGPAPFFLQQGQSVEVQLMRADEQRLPYAKANGMQAVRLPYKGDDLSMTVILPDRQTKIQDINLSTPGLTFGSQKVRVSMPKYKVETGYSLKKPLQSLGLVTAFDNLADFSLLSPERLKISKVKHKAYVEVDEQGTEAAAATTVGMVRATSVSRPPIEFKVDRPFLFTIEHLPSKTTLFLGRVMNPVA